MVNECVLMQHVLIPMQSHIAAVVPEVSYIGTCHLVLLD